jgi:hypothetical protein
MPPQCNKNGCKNEAANKLRFVDPYRKDIDTDDPIALCEEHTKEAKRFPKTDVEAIKRWLKS